MEWDLLEKTTFWVEGARLDGANLGEVAAAAASALGLDPDEALKHFAVLENQQRGNAVDAITAGDVGAFVDVHLRH